MTNLKELLKELLEVDSITSLKDGVYIARKIRPKHTGFFFLPSDNSDAFARRISRSLSDAGISYSILGSSVHWTTSSRTIPISQSNHYWCEFKIKE